jgi:hypothetical protein
MTFHFWVTESLNLLAASAATLASAFSRANSATAAACRLSMFFNLSSVPIYLSWWRALFGNKASP